MTKDKQSRAEELREYGVSLEYLARYAGRRHGYVKTWSCGFAVSPYLEKKAAELIKNRKAELAKAGK